MTVEMVLKWIRENREERLLSIWEDSNKPSPVGPKEIPKPAGRVRKLGIPTVVDRVIQQVIAQKLQPIFEPLFSDGNLITARKERSSSIQKVKSYAELGCGYCYLDLT